MNQIAVFEYRMPFTDPDGNTEPGPWIEWCRRPVHAETAFQTERVQQGRLHDVQTGVLRTWRDPEVDDITASMRVRFAEGWLNKQPAAIKTVVFENATTVAIHIEIGEEP
jgi:hypothetical protein